VLIGTEGAEAPPANIPRVGDAQPVQMLFPAVKSPKSCEFTVDAIVMYSIEKRCILR
jgi:hypothetical protein